MSYTKGELVHCSAEFQAYVDGVLTYINPATINFKFKRSGLAATTYVYGVNAELKKSADGKYYVDLDTSVADGTWYYKFWSTGSYQAAKNGSFEVLKDDI
jgi:hypothetical protein